MPEFIPTEADVAEWSGQEVQPETVNLQEQADRHSARSFERAEINLSRRNTTQGIHDPISATDDELYSISQALAKAEADNDYHNAARYEAILDGLVAGDLKLKSAQPKQSKIDSSKTVSGTTQAQGGDDIQGSSDDDSTGFTDYASASAVNDAMGGPEEADKVIAFINDSYDEGELKTVLKALEGDNSDDATLAMTVAKQRMNQANKGITSNGVGFDESSANQLSETYGARADEIVALSNQVRDGEVTQAAAMAKAMSDPQLLATAQRMLADGSITFA